MTLAEFNIKIKTLKKNYPPNEGVSGALAVRYYLKVIYGWIDQLKTVSDARIALKKVRSSSFREYLTKT